MSDETTTVHDDPPWEPPTRGTEVEHLLGALDRLRTTFRWKAEDPDALYARYDAAVARARARFREAIDGRTGEDPDPDWRPVRGHYAFH